MAARNSLSPRTYTEWRDGALRHDRRHRLDLWQKRDHDTEYDYGYIRVLLERLHRLRASRDNHGLLFLLNEGIHGNMGGMGNRALYHKARAGTKQLIVDLTEEIVAALEHIASPRIKDITVVDKVDFFHRASHCYGRSALMLSGAAMLVYFHVGVIKALWEQRLLPSVVSGASGGALVAAIVGTHTYEELGKIFDPDYLLIDAPIEASDSWSLFKPAAMSATDVRALLERLLPDLTFQEAFDRTGVNFSVSVSPTDPRAGSRLLNAMTSPNVMVREAVLASCSVPGLYPPVTLVAKNVKGERQRYLPAKKWVDGSLNGDLPMKRIMRLYGVNHFVVSQTNPLVLPFVNPAKQPSGVWKIMQTAAQESAKAWLLAGVRLIQGPASLNPSITRMVGLTTSLLSQTYSGDITILPAQRWHRLDKLLVPPDRAGVAHLIREGERATWPEIEAIRVQTRVSRVLDDITHRYERSLLRRAQRLRSSQRRRIHGAR